MEDTLITFETAKLAKEKMFDENILNYFKIGVISLGLQEESLEKYQKITSIFPNSAVFARPTQSLLQKWLREVHQIHIKVDYMFGTYMFLFQKLNEEVKTDPSFKEYKTYEEALEIALQEGLRLIK